MSLLGQGGKWFGEKQFEVFADPEDYIGAAQHGGVGRAQGVVVGRRAALDDQRRGSNAVHHGRDDGMDRHDADDHLGRRGAGGAGNRQNHNQGGKEATAEHGDLNQLAGFL